MINYHMTYFLSERFPFSDNAPFALATALVLSDICSDRNAPGHIHSSITSLIGLERTLDGAEPSAYEIGPWSGRYFCDDALPEGIPADSYFAWVSPDFWDYDPPAVFYSKAQFIELFSDCCRNYVKAYPQRREEFLQAMEANGMHL